MLTTILILLVINLMFTVVLINMVLSFKTTYDETIGAYLNYEEHNGPAHDKAFNRD